MAYEFKLPDLGEGLTEGEIARWLVAEGQEIAEDEPLVEIQTDKTTVEIPSPSATRIRDTVPAAPTEAAAAPGRPGEREELVLEQHKPSPGRVQATPLVRRLAAELGVDLGSLSGSGPNGRIVEADVRGAAENELVLEQHKASQGRREPVRGVRRQIVEHLTRAHREVPAVTFVEECDFTGIDVKLLVPLALKAAAASLREFPELNARLEDGEIVYLDRYDLGVAVQTDAGLVVPVVRRCDSAPVEELAAEVARLADAARAGTLAPAELRGGTFTLTSAGKLGGLLVTPLVNHPEVGILGLHRIAPRPVVRDGEIVVREVGNVSLTFDHRVVDGARAAAFTLDVIERLQRAA
jgi:pyruvate dehydrogenase E2 component (dihydrolipoamide acetyltransferase)